jgi:hypothetical protein
VNNDGKVDSADVKVVAEKAAEKAKTTVKKAAVKAKAVVRNKKPKPAPAAKATTKAAPKKA